MRTVAPDGGPWGGYDEQTVGEIAGRLRAADAQLAVHVRAYELEHKQRRGVIRATERELGQG